MLDQRVQVWTAEAVLVCALELLGRSASSFPPIEFVHSAPADVSAGAEAFVRTNSPRIYILTTSTSFRRLQFSFFRCGDLMAARKLASILVHEEVHLKQGGTEEEAYAAQLTTLTLLGSGIGTPPYMETSRAMQQARKQKAPDLVTVVASGPTDESRGGWSWSAPISGTRAGAAASRGFSR